MIGEPLASRLPVHDTVADVLPRTADAAVGALGTPAGVIAFEAADATDVPTVLVAVTLNV